MNKHIVNTVILFLLSISGISQVYAAIIPWPTTLDVLAQDGSLALVNDKQFSNFTISTGGDIASDIKVTRLIDTAGNPGMTFTALNGALTSSATGLEQLSFKFDVTVLDPNKRIKDVEITTTANGTSWWTSETLYDPGKSGLDFFSHVSTFESAHSPANDVFTPRKTLTAMYFAQVSDGEDIQSMTITFSQMTVPIPAAIWLFISGCGLLIGVIRKRA